MTTDDQLVPITSKYLTFLCCEYGEKFGKGTDKNTKLTNLFQFTLSLPPENMRKSYGFLMFSEGRERVHWEQMG